MYFMYLKKNEHIFSYKNVYNNGISIQKMYGVTKIKMSKFTINVKI